MRGPAVLDQAGATRPSVSNDSTAATELFEPDAVEDSVHEAEQRMKGPLPHEGHDHQRKDEREEVDGPEDEGTTSSAPQKERQKQPDDDRRDRSDDHPDDVVEERPEDGRAPEHLHVVRQQRRSSLWS